MIRKCSVRPCSFSSYRNNFWYCSIPDGKIDFQKPVVFRWIERLFAFHCIESWLELRHNQCHFPLSMWQRPMYILYRGRTICQKLQQIAVGTLSWSYSEQYLRLTTTVVYVQHEDRHKLRGSSCSTWTPSQVVRIFMLDINDVWQMKSSLKYFRIVPFSHN